MKTLFTIGHSRHEPDYFIDLLKMHDIAAVYDVRSKPYSRFQRQFNRESLVKWLAEAGISYVFMGDALGGRPEDPCCYVNGEISYDLQAATLLFQRGLERLRADIDTKRIAIMCAEKDPLNCHRTWAISQNLPDMEIVHIHADGRLESHESLMTGVAPKQARLL
jgi:uncharacterized protein (DUF488 family)